ncbi:hypothetical protein ACJ72_07804 [Emergomyces africanus]|uniref:Uncharacterized protein n=1 Tax=Emergomyces africanus TaxID=1955775 RepID=A0A1B7NM77_9EURO|nr:hypothetical protein ACJ72_07804 [Emergomyces africanus]
MRQRLDVVVEVGHNCCPLTVDDGIFVMTIKDEADIYTVPIPAHGRGIQMTIKKVGYSEIRANKAILRKPTSHL